jgi:hypothetical protein
MKYSNGFGAMQRYFRGALGEDPLDMLERLDPLPLPKCRLEDGTEHTYHFMSDNVDEHNQPRTEACRTYANKLAYLGEGWICEIAGSPQEIRADEAKSHFWGLVAPQKFARQYGPEEHILQTRLNQINQLGWVTDYRRSGGPQSHLTHVFVTRADATTMEVSGSLSQVNRELAQLYAVLESLDQGRVELNQIQETFDATRPNPDSSPST